MTNEEQIILRIVFEITNRLDEAGQKRDRMQKNSISWIRADAAYGAIHEAACSIERIMLDVDARAPSC